MEFVPQSIATARTSNSNYTTVPDSAPGPRALVDIGFVSDAISSHFHSNPTRKREMLTRVRRGVSFQLADLTASHAGSLGHDPSGYIDSA